MVVIGNRRLVKLRDATFLRADGARKVTEVIDGERKIGSHGLANRLAVVPGLDGGEHLEVVFHALGDPHQHLAACRGRGLTPGLLRGVCGIEREIDVRGV